jgi:hypothetical protein
MNYTIHFDEELHSKISHFNAYPEMLPFIGCRWHIQKSRILILGESHYIDGETIDQFFPKDNYCNNWYKLSSEPFDGNLKNYINTRNSITEADDLAKYGRNSSLLSYYNMKEVIKEVVPALRDEPQVFPNFAYMNYFQRPAFTEGASIIVTASDKEVAYNTFKAVISIIQPTAVHINSSKAYDAFAEFRNTDLEDDSCYMIPIDFSPHAGSAWWNRDAEKYDGQTGREVFENFIKHHYIHH